MVDFNNSAPPPDSATEAFWAKYSPTLAETIVSLTATPRHLACFVIHRAAQELAPEPNYVVPGLLVLNDNPKSPLVVGHCRLAVGRSLLDFAFAGVEAYGVPPNTPYEFIMAGDPKLESFTEMDERVIDNLENGVNNAEAFWAEHGEKARLAIEIAANGGNVVVMGDTGVDNGGEFHGS